MIDCNQEDKCRVCGGDGSACETTSNVIKDQDMTMGYNDLAMIPPGATNIRIAEVQFFSSSIKWIGHSLQPCDFRWRLPTTTWPWGTRPATITWTATGGSTTHSSSRQRVSCSLWQHSIHPSIHPSIPSQEQHSTTRESTRTRRHGVPSPSLHQRAFGLWDQQRRLFSLWSASLSSE